MKSIKLQVLLFALGMFISFQASAFVDCREAAKEATYEQKATCGESQVHIARKKPSGDDIVKGIVTFRISNDDSQPIIWDEYLEKREMTWFEDGKEKTSLSDVWVRDIVFYPGQDNWEVMNGVCKKILGDEFKYDYLTASYVGFTYPRYGNATRFYTEYKDGINIAYHAFDWKTYAQYKETPEFSDQEYVSPQKTNMILRSFSCRSLTKKEMSSLEIVEKK